MSMQSTRGANVTLLFAVLVTAAVTLPAAQTTLHPSGALAASAAPTGHTAVAGAPDPDNEDWG